MCIDRPVTELRFEFRLSDGIIALARASVSSQSFQYVLTFISDTLSGTIGRVALLEESTRTAMLK